MNKDYLKILDKFKGKKAGVFIDEANLFYSQKQLGWNIDWEKTMSFLRKFYNLEVINYYMGMPRKGKSYEKNVLIKNRLEEMGIKVITKPLKKIYLDNQKQDFKYKCNFDVEITIDVIRSSNDLDLILLFSSDSDFIGLRNDTIRQGKGLIFICFNKNAAWEIRRSYHLFLENIRDNIEFKE